jgi:hypothetical protein
MGARAWGMKAANPVADLLDTIAHMPSAKCNRVGAVHVSTYAALGAQELRMRSLMALQRGADLGQLRGRAIQLAQVCQARSLALQLPRQPLHVRHACDRAGPDSSRLQLRIEPG